MTTTLAEAHRSAGATLVERDGVAVPRSFGDPAEELAAARSAAGLVDRSWLGRLQLTGTQRLPYVHRVSAQAFLGLRPPGGVRAAVLERTGKIIDLLTVHAFPDHLLAIASAGRRGAVRDWLRKFVFRDDVQVEDRTDGTGHLLLLGPRAGDVAVALAGEGAAALPPHGWMELPQAGSFLIRGGPQGAPFLLVGEAQRLPEVWAAALEAGRPLGLRAVGEAAFQAARVLAGLPEGGCEIDERSNPLELGAEDSLDLGKGCFTGQEVLAKMITHRSVRRRLVGLDLAAEAPPAPGAEVLAAGERAGRVTSAVVLPGDARCAALALVHREHAEPGNTLQVGPAAALVRPLPFPPA